MFSDDEQFHHDMSVMQQKQPTAPGAFNGDRVNRPEPSSAPEPEALWLTGFALTVVLVIIRQIEWYWIVAYQIASMIWMYRKEK